MSYCCGWVSSRFGLSSYWLVPFLFVVSFRSLFHSRFSSALFVYIPPYIYWSSTILMAQPKDSTDFNIDSELLDLSMNEPQTSKFNELTLIGRIISDKTINFKAIKAILSNAWDLDTKGKVSHLDKNLFSCSFGNITAKNKVLNACPWSIKGHIIILQSWSPGFSLEEIVFHYPRFGSKSITSP